MAVTVNQQPEDYTPGYSPQIFTASSNQTAQPNFNYTVVCTDVISGDTQTIQVPPTPVDGDCIFDAKPFTETFLDHFIPINTYGWREVTGIRKIRVNIGETYGTTPAYASGSNIDFIAWNGILDWKEYPVYDPTDYIYDAPTDNIIYLNPENEDTYVGRSNMLYTIGNTGNGTNSIEIKTYNNSGVLINTSQIPNPYELSADYREKYICIDIGHKGLTEIASGLVTGDYPIMTDDCAYYTIGNYNDNGVDVLLSQVKTVYVKCEPKYDVYTVHYLRKNGAFQTLNFSKLSETTLTKTQTSYSVLPFTYSANEYKYSASSRVKKVLSSDRLQRVKLNTDWMTPDEVEYHKDLLDATVIYFDFGTSEDYIQVTLNTDSYKLNKRYNEKLYSMTMDFEYAHYNTRQSS